MTRSKKIVGLASRAAALLLAAAMLAFAFACKGTGKNPAGLTDKQLADIEQIAEAFFECGVEVDSTSALPVAQIETFVNFLYNDELTAGEDGFGVVSKDEADERLYYYFAFKPVLRTRKNNSGKQDFYFDNNNYYVRVKPNAADTTRMISAEKSDDGLLKVSYELKSAEAGAILDLVFEPSESGLKVIECTRLDQK